MIYIEMIEVPPKGGSEVLHSNGMTLPSDVNIFWNVRSLIVEDGLPSHSGDSKEKTGDSQKVVIHVVTHTCLFLSHF